MKAATVIASAEFDAKAGRLLTSEELDALEFSLATHPTAHPVIPGTSGIRKARWGRSGNGKRGGVRVIYFYVISAEVVALIDLYAKNEKENLTNDEKKRLRRIAEEICESAQKG